MRKQVVPKPSMELWLERLGYSAEAASLHLANAPLGGTHPYALEIKALLRPDGAVRAKAVFDVEGTPTVVFVGDGDEPLSPRELDDVRKRIWNQNLASVVIDVQGQEALVLPARKLATSGANRLTLTDARSDGLFSASDISSSQLALRNPSWFEMSGRVDRRLLANLSTLVSSLVNEGFKDSKSDWPKRELAQMLVGQLLFVSYLEHRQIVGVTYRGRRSVDTLHQLIARADRKGVANLIDLLRADFNGDFLGDDRHHPWTALADSGFKLIDGFLHRTDMSTGQTDFWNYDFSYIPVELLSGLYESFLSHGEQSRTGAYYTPRNLAMLAVNEALARSEDPLSETIFDGACGSGILLTTAYRRLIALSEARNSRKLTFAERGRLLKNQIFGGDISPSACRVTAFSLYLSLMEDLDPADILAAQDQEDAKLPTLAATNLIHGDFFNLEHCLRDRLFSLIICNPPWTEPKGSEITSVDKWAELVEMPFVRRQIAGAFAIRALDFLGEQGRVCLLLPIGQLVGSSSAMFVAHLLKSYKPELLINFGDLQGLLFPSAEPTCHVFVGQRRPSHSSRIPFAETFTYCIPKADLSLALGRLTMQSADLHRLQTSAVADDPQLLVTMMWGDANDLAVWTRLSAHGTFADFWRDGHSSRRWINRKGIHLVDASRTPVDAGPLLKMKFISPANLSMGLPALDVESLGYWPKDRTKVVGLNEDVLRVFNGPRVVFPDGFSKEEHSIRAVYLDGRASFTHSIGVIAGAKKDSGLLQFVAVYLRSRLARYFLMMRGWKMLCERNGVHLSDVESFPFFDPSQAPNPTAAKSAMDLVQTLVAGISASPEIGRLERYEAIQDKLDEAVFDYFDLGRVERDVVKESVDLLMPSIRPRSFKSLYTLAQRDASQSDINKYARALADSLSAWRKLAGGRGHFVVRILGLPNSRPLGVVSVSYAEEKTTASKVETAAADELASKALTSLRTSELDSVSVSGSVSLVPDAHVWVDGLLYIARPRTARGWTVRVALRDAERIVRTVQSNAARASVPN